MTIFNVQNYHKTRERLYTMFNSAHKSLKSNPADPDLFPDPEGLFRIRIKQNMKEKINTNYIYNYKPLNSGLWCEIENVIYYTVVCNLFLLNFSL